MDAVGKLSRNKRIESYRDRVVLLRTNFKFPKTFETCFEDFRNHQISSEKQVTLPTAVVACNMLIDKIEKIVFNLDNSMNRNINDETMLLAFQSGRDKILKHYTQ